MNLQSEEGSSNDGTGTDVHANGARGRDGLLRILGVGGGAGSDGDGLGDDGLGLGDNGALAVPVVPAKQMSVTGRVDALGAAKAVAGARTWYMRGIRLPKQSGRVTY